MKPEWYAVAVKARKERYVQNQLLANGYLVACPRYQKTVRHARNKRHVFAPLFPGYLFVRLNLETDNWRLVNSLPGSIGLIKFGDRPSALNMQFVEEYILCIDVGGCVSFEHEIKLGDRVQAVGGPLHQMHGEVVEMTCDQRVKVLMEALNRKVETTLPRRALVVAA
ncbi:MAG: transcription termination/antitermination NusG family protein [Pseudomonadota bacterium]